MELTPSFRLLLQHFRPVFTAPSFRLFVLIVTGWALSCRHRYITECIFSAGQVGIGRWSCYHRFLSHYAWSLDGLCQVLAQRLIERSPSGKGGARRKRGERLPGLQEWADDAACPWQKRVFDPYGLHATLQVKVQQALYYKAGKDRLLTILLLHEKGLSRVVEWAARVG